MKIDPFFSLGVALSFCRPAFSAPSGQSPATLGRWDLGWNTEIAAMHMVMVSPTEILFIDKAEKNLLWDDTGKHYARSGRYDLTTGNVSEVTLNSNTFCSAGAFLADGTLIETGGGKSINGSTEGAGGGFQTIRMYNSCKNPQFSTEEQEAGFKCDTWNEFISEPGFQLQNMRWYNTMTSLPDGRIFILGGANDSVAFNAPKVNQPSYEFYPGNNTFSSAPFPFLEATLPYNLYPFVSPMPGYGHLLLVFANTQMMLWDWVNGRQAPSFVNPIKGSRSYPTTAGIILSPLDYANNYQVQLLICGGNAMYSPTSPAIGNCGYVNPLSTKKTDWTYFNIKPVVMPDMTYLPDGTIVMLNGASIGYAGYARGQGKTIQWRADNPVQTPQLIDLSKTPPKVTVLADSGIPRMYHSVSTLLPNGTIFVAGSNPIQNWCEDKSICPKYQTEYRSQIFTPPYLFAQTPRSKIVSVDNPKPNYGNTIVVTLAWPKGTKINTSLFTASMIHNGFVTHSNHMSQRYVKLRVTANSDGTKVSVQMPPGSDVISPGNHLLFILYNGMPCQLATEISLTCPRRNRSTCFKQGQWPPNMGSKQAQQVLAQQVNDLQQQAQVHVQTLAKVVTSIHEDMGVSPI